MSLRTRITLTYSALIVLGVLVASLFSSAKIKDFLNTRTATQLIEHDRLLTQLFASGSLRLDSTGTNDARFGEIAKALGIRLTLISKNGVVLYDSDVRRDSLGTLENHGTRPEVQQAREGGTGSFTRTSHSVGVDFLYTASRIDVPGDRLLDSGFVRVALPLTEVRELDNQIQKIILLLALVAIVLTVFVSFQVSKRITEPVHQIAATTQAIKRGELEQRVAVRSHDEIGALAAAINDMADTLGQDIVRMKKLERVRTEFLGNVSHELRTPIFSIQGFLETLLDGAIDDPNVNREFLEKAHRHTVRLNALLRDLIEISRIETGDMKMSFRYFPIIELVRSVAEEMRPEAARKRLELSVRSESPADLQAYGDRDRLKQVLVNLIDNAIKYTEPGGSIVCSVAADTTMCSVSVSDTGCGIAPEHQDRIFERFYRVDRDRSREVGGTGLGLAIVKHIVEAHGGTIGVSSTVGKGRTFTFTLKR